MVWRSGMVGKRASATVLLPMGPQAVLLGAPERWQGDLAEEFKRARQQSLRDGALRALGGGGHLAAVAAEKGLPVGVP